MVAIIICLVTGVCVNVKETIAAVVVKTLCCAYTCILFWLPEIPLLFFFSLSVTLK